MDMTIDPPNAPVTSPTPLANSVNVTNVNVDRLASAATDFLDAADKRVPTLGRNARRKYFHALAVVMLVPGIAFDVRSPSSFKDRLLTFTKCNTYVSLRLYTCH